MATITPPLKWHGGKHYLAKKIIALMPPHLSYVEPFAGGLAVLLEKDPTNVSEVVNDVYGELTNFWNVLRCPTEFEQFRRFVEATPFSENTWEQCEIDGKGFPVDRAYRFFVRCRQSRAGCFDDFATISKSRTRRGMNEQVSAWLSAVDGLPAVHARLRRVLILNRQAVDVIHQLDSPQTLFYCDPPYLHETRATTDAYEHEMTQDQHDELLQVLSSIQGRFLLSGYRSKLYDYYAERHGWKRVDFELPNNAAGGKTKRRMTECVWGN